MAGPTAAELMTTGLHREIREAEQATRIRSTVLALQQGGIAAVPPAVRLVGLNTRRNTSVPGEWLEVLDLEALEDAIRSCRALLVAVRAYAGAHAIDLPLPVSR